MKTKQSEVVVILTAHKIQCGTEDRNVSAQARYIFNRNRARAAQLEQICMEPANLGVDLENLRGALTSYLQNKWPSSTDETGRITVLAQQDDSDTWIIFTGSTKKDKPLPKPKRSMPMGSNDKEEQDEMTNAQAKEEARKRYGKNFLIIRDPMKSSPRQRRQAHRDYIQHTILLKARTDIPPRVRRQVDTSMHIANKVSTYYQYKIGTLMRLDFDFVVFTMYVQGDSWEDCFAKLQTQSDDKKRKQLWGVSGDGTFHDKPKGG